MATITIVHNGNHENVQATSTPTNKAALKMSPNKAKRSISHPSVSHPDKTTASSKVQSAQPILDSSSYHPSYSISEQQSFGPKHQTTQSNDHEEIDMDLVIDSLETSEVDYQPTPSGLKRLIDKLCDKHHVDSPISFPSSTNSKEIHILGGGALKIKKELIRLASKEFTGYSFSISDSGPLHTEQYRGSVQQKIGDEERGVWTDGAYTFCDLVVSGTVLNQEVLAPDRSLYAVTPAHLVLNNEHCDEILNGESPAAIRKMRKKINKNVHTERYFLRKRRTNATNNHDEAIVDLQHPTMISYRHYFSNVSTTTNESSWICCGGICKIHEDCPHLYMNDIALLPIGHQEALTEEQRAILQNLRFSRIATLQGEKLDRMIGEGRILRIGNHRCKLVPQIDTNGETPEKAYANHIVFRMADQGRRLTLTPGESGSILYLPNGERRLAIAMFIGKVKFTEDHYQAILLRPALKDIELDYRLHVADLSH